MPKGIESEVARVEVALCRRVERDEGSYRCSNPFQLEPLPDKYPCLRIGDGNEGHRPSLLNAHLQPRAMPPLLVCQKGIAS